MLELGLSGKSLGQEHAARAAALNELTGMGLSGEAWQMAEHLGKVQQESARLLVHTAAATQGRADEDRLVEQRELLSLLRN